MDQIQPGLENSTRKNAEIIIVMHILGYIRSSRVSTTNLSFKNKPAMLGVFWYYSRRFFFEKPSPPFGVIIVVIYCPPDANQRIFFDWVSLPPCGWQCDENMFSPPFISVPSFKVPCA